MNKEIDVANARSERKRVTLNISKIQAALCIALSIAVSVTVIGWLLS